MCLYTTTLLLLQFYQSFVPSAHIHQSYLLVVIYHLPYNCHTCCEKRNPARQTRRILLRRRHMLEDALRNVRHKGFSFHKVVEVKFRRLHTMLHVLYRLCRSILCQLSRRGVQYGGGPAQEFWKLLFKELMSSLFESADERRHDHTGLQVAKLINIYAYFIWSP